MSESVETIRDEIAGMSREELERYAYTMSREQDRLHSLLNLIPPCPEHGNLCMSHAVDWIKEQVAMNIVWIVEKSYNHKGKVFYGVFSTKEKAIRYCEEERNQPLVFFGYDERLDFEAQFEDFTYHVFGAKVDVHVDKVGD
jgi:hypothetical protein